LLCVVILLTGFLLLPPVCGWLRAAQGPGFDKLSEADKKEFAQRFKGDLWTLLERRGKDGCVGCHVAKHRTALKFIGDPERDFRTLLAEGFFLKDDSGSLLAHVLPNRRNGRMPPGNRPLWTAAEIQVLRDFVNDLDKKQQGGR
jgi:hypothetical protein